MMISKEFKVAGHKINGQIVGNWSSRSYYAFKFSNNTMGIDDLDVLISEITTVRDKIKELNEEKR